MNLQTKIKLTWAQTWALVALAGWLCTAYCLWANYHLRQTIVFQFQHQLATHP